MTIRLLMAASLTSLALLVACSDDDGDAGSGGSGTGTGTGTATGTGTGQGGDGGDGGMGAGGEGGGMAAVGRVRVAHLSPDAPDVDFCVSADGGATWVGPVAENVLMASDGLPYSGVTDYIPLPAATYDVRLVATDATDCDTGLLPNDFIGITLPEDVDATIAATGWLSPPTGNDPAFDLTVYVDDNSDPASGKAHLRFIHASPDTPAVDVGVGSEAGNDFTAIWTDTAFPEVGDPAYFETDPLMDITISARASGSSQDAIVIDGVALPEGAIATAFAIGNLGGDPEPLSVLLCVDNADPVSCTVLP